MLTLFRARQLIPAANKLISIKLMPNNLVKLFDDIPKVGASWYPKSAATAVEMGVEIEEHLHQLLGTKPANMCDYHEKLVEFAFANSAELKECKANVELQSIESQVVILGHPDLVGANVIWDVKCTGRFGAMKKDCIHQLLIYYCLSRRMNLGQKSVGLVLPFQNMVVCADISQWDWKPYWAEVVNIAVKQATVWPNLNIFMVKYGDAIGNHVPLKEVHEHVNMPALQFFLSSNRCAEIKIKPAEKVKLKDTVSRARYCAVHAPYTLNLTQKYDDNYVIKSLVRQMVFASEVGIRHIVIHVGIWSAQQKKEGMTEDVAVERMRENLLGAIIEAGGANCKILLETPAGEKGELLNSAREFCDFVESMNGEVGVCVDTCHVFSAGHDPLNYLMEVRERDIAVDLVHYNDSQTKLGGCCDRHARLLFGEIGHVKLEAIARHCIESGIPMVHE